MKHMTIWEGLLLGGLILGTIGIGSVVVRHWALPMLPLGSVHSGTNTAPDVSPAEMTQRWMDSQGRIWERQANGQERLILDPRHYGAIVFGTSLQHASQPQWSTSANAVGLALSTITGPTSAQADLSGVSPEPREATPRRPNEIARITHQTHFLGIGIPQSQCLVTIHADDGREACLDWRSGTVTVTGDLPVAESARLFVEALSAVAPWPPTCVGKE